MTIPLMLPGTSPDITPGGRKMQLIKRDLDMNSPTYGEDLIILDILGPDIKAQGVCLLTSFSGLYHAPRTPVRQSWAFQEGSTPSPFPRVEERLIDIRLGTQGNTQLEWEQIDSNLWQVLSFTEDAILRIHSALSPPRELKVRLDRKPKDLMTYDTSAQNLMIWEITLVCCDPWYYSTTVTSTWTNTAGTGSGFITVSNPADVQCWLQWASGPLTTAQTWTIPDGIAIWPTGSKDFNGNDISGQNVTHALPTLGPGQEFLLDTNPLSATLQVMTGAQAWAQMQGASFQYALPPNCPPTQVPIKVVNGTTASTVTAYATLRHDRPWGG
jgi:hypothetical protein